MASRKFALPGEFSPPEGYVVQQIPDHGDWVFTANGQELSITSVRYMIDQQLRMANRAKKEQRRSFRSADENADTDALEQERLALIQDFLAEATLLKEMMDESEEELTQLASSGMQAEHEFYSQASDHEKAIGSKDDSLGPVVGFIGSHQPLLTNAISSFYKACLQCLTLLEEAVNMPNEVVGKHAEAANNFSVLERMPKVIEKIESSTSTFLDLLKNKQPFPCVIRTPNEVSELFVQWRGLIADLNGIFTAAGVTAEERSELVGITTFVDSIHDALPKYFNIRQVISTLNQKEQGLIRDIVDVAHRYQKKAAEKHDAIARSIRELLVDIAALLLSDPSDDIEGHSGDINTARRHIEAFFDRNKVQIVRIVQKQPANAGSKRSGKKGKAKNKSNKKPDHRSKILVLKKTEKLMNKYLRTLDLARDDIRLQIAVALDLLRYSFETVGSKYKAGYQSGIMSLPQEED